MKHIIIALAALAACNQTVTKITSDSPLALHCAGGGWCDRRTETCGANGTCIYIGPSDRAFGSKAIDAGTDR